MKINCFAIILVFLLIFIPKISRRPKREFGNEAIIAAICDAPE